MSNFGANHVQKGGQASSNNWCVGIFIQSSHVAFQYHTERCVTTEYSLAVLDIAFKELQPQDVAVEGWRMSRSISIVELCHIPQATGYYVDCQTKYNVLG